ncbi:MAG TPA: DUF951 domain-containing protein [Bacilli bacterium]|nr:DUF951 domain-containing protein [Bacilli bacterium]
MEFIKIDLFDLVEMKKEHPCQTRSRLFQVVRVGADIKIQCQGCGNIIMMPRFDFNKRLKKIISHHDDVLFVKKDSK